MKMSKEKKVITEDEMPRKKTIYINTMKGAKEMLKDLPDINYELNDEGTTLLEMVCAFTKDVDVVEYLLKKGADIHHTDKYGRNAFAYAWFNEAPYMDVFINQVLKRYWNKKDENSILKSDDNKYES